MYRLSTLCFFLCLVAGLQAMPFEQAPPEKEGERVERQDRSATRGKDRTFHSRKDRKKDRKRRLRLFSKKREAGRRVSGDLLVVAITVFVVSAISLILAILSLFVCIFGACGAFNFFIILFGISLIVGLVFGILWLTRYAGGGD